MKRKSSASVDTLYVSHVSDSLLMESEPSRRLTWFAKTPWLLLRDREKLELIDLWVYAVMALRARKCVPLSIGNRLIGRVLAISQRTVSRSIDRLVKQGHLIRREGKRGQRTVYEFTSWVFKHVDRREDGEVRVTQYSGVPIHAGMVPEPVSKPRRLPKKLAARAV